MNRRERCNQIIAQVAAANPSLPEKELRKKISEAYPFGLREYSPYKTWLRAVKAYFTPKQAEPVKEVVDGLFKGKP